MTIIKSEEDREVYTVDFKTREKIVHHVKYKWMCNHCGAKFLYDQQQAKNDKRLITNLQIGDENVQVDICESCIYDMYEVVKG